MHEEQLLSRFSAETSMHGVSRFTDRERNPGVRAIWVLLFLSTTGAFLYSFIESVKRYKEFNTNTGMTTVSASNMYFPSVTICNDNFVMKSNVESTNPFVKQASLLLIPGRAHESTLDLTDEATTQILRSINMTELGRSAGQRDWQMLLGCKFGGHGDVYSCNYSNWKFVENDMGTCLTFNSKEFLKTNTRFQSKLSGLSYGLSVIANVDIEEYMWTPRYYEGLKLLVHEPEQMYDPVESGISVGPGTVANIEINKVNVIRLPYPYTSTNKECRDTSKESFISPLKHYSPYLFSTCIKDCEAEYIIKRCGCLPYMYPNPNKVTPCDMIDLVICFENTRIELSQNTSIHAACDCRYACNETHYTHTMSTATFPSKISFDQVFQPELVPDKTLQWARENLVLINIYFKEMSYVVVEQVEAYSGTSLFGEVGGQMGLCLGASLLTLGEILEVFVSLICRCTKADKKKNAVGQKTDQNAMVKVHTVMHT